MDDPSPPDTTKFPDPHRYASYLNHRSPAFKTHSSLRSVKGAISGKSRSHGKNRVLACHAYVYEFNFETGLWDEVAYLPKDTMLEQDPWYSVSQKKSRAVIGPSQNAVDRAIASITGSS